jgi:hypothetical protein
MIDYSIKNLKIIFLLFLTLSVCSIADSIDISQNKQISILKHTYVYIEENPSSIQNVLKYDLFKAYKNPYINIGVSQKTIWIKIQLHNPTDKPIKKNTYTHLFST